MTRGNNKTSLKPTGGRIAVPTFFRGKGRVGKSFLYRDKSYTFERDTVDAPPIKVWQFTGMFIQHLSVQAAPKEQTYTNTH